MIKYRQAKALIFIFPPRKVLTSNPHSRSAVGLLTQPDVVGRDRVAGVTEQRVNAAVAV